MHNANAVAGPVSHDTLHIEALDELDEICPPEHVPPPLRTISPALQHATAVFVVLTNVMISVGARSPGGPCRPCGPADPCGPIGPGGETTNEQYAAGSLEAVTGWPSRVQVSEVVLVKSKVIDHTFG